MAVSHSIPSTTTEPYAQPSDISLTSVYERPDRHSILLKLLYERDPSINISHKKLPTWEQHVQFVESHPYQAWYFIGKEPKGACYLSHQNEIGIFLFGSHQGKGYGPQVIQALIEKHGPGRYLANVNPRNERSAEMFYRMGFTLIQHTYELIA
jgi:RimJ/RimL family protein N-acetyltransferase